MRRLLSRPLSLSKRVLSSVSRPPISADVACVDSFYGDLPEYACSYVIQDPQGSVVVDPTTNFAVPRILDCLKSADIFPEEVSHIVITHIHLDHAGGTGLLSSICPNATVVAHPKAAKFACDPAGIIAGASAVYGKEKFEALYGEPSSILPVDPGRIIEITEEHGQYITLPSGRTLTFDHSLGHASHHMVIHDDATNGCFTGDSFGMNYPQFGEYDYILPSTTPIDFDPYEAMASVEMIASMDGLERVYLTHFGIWEEVQLGAELNFFALEKMLSVVKAIPERMDFWHSEVRSESFEGSDVSSDAQAEAAVEERVREWIEGQLWDILEAQLDIPRRVVETDVPVSTDVYLNAWGSYVFVLRRLKKGLEV